MRLLPLPSAEVDISTLYGNADRMPPPGRPYVVVNMVSSVDGATALGGVSGGLGSPMDRAIFLHLRGVADAILVGAATIRAERYGPAKPTAEVQAQRVERGQAARPPVIGVSRSVDFAWETPFFTDAVTRPILLVPADADGDKLGRARRSAEVITAGEGGVDLVEGLSQLRRRGIAVLLCEGGPSLNSQLLGAGLVDELCLTVAPVVTGGSEPRGIFASGTDGFARPLTVAHILEEDSFLYLRYRASPPSGS